MSSLLAFLLLHAPETEYFGIYAAGTRLGYTAVTETPSLLDGKPVVLRHTHLGLKKSSMDEDVWIGQGNHPLKIDFVYRRETGVLKAHARFRGTTVDWDLEQCGKTARRSLPVPKGEVLADPLRVIRDRLVDGRSLTFLEFNSEKGIFNSVTVRRIGPATYREKDRVVSTTLSEVKSGHTALRQFTDGRGALLRTEFPGNGLLQRTSRKAALGL